MQIVDKGDHLGGSGYMLMIYQGNLLARVNKNNATWISYPYPNDGEWHHVAYSFKSGEQKLYIDGSVVATTAVSTTINTNAQPLLIGRGVNRPQYCWNGEIDEVRIWNGALGDDAIRQSYELGGPQTSPSVVKLKHKVLIGGEVVVFTSAFLLGSQIPETSKTVDIYIMSSSGDREIDDVGLRRVTPGKTEGGLVSAANWVSDTHWQATVTNGTDDWKDKTSTSIHLYAELDTDELLGVNAQYLP